MQTATEIRKEDQERLERAARYERLLGERVSMQQQIQVLEAKPPLNVAGIRQLAELTADIPSDIVSRGVSSMGIVSVPGGHEVSPLMSALARQVLAEVERRDAQRTSSLAAKRQRLIEVEEELKEFSD